MKTISNFYGRLKSSILLFFLCFSSLLSSAQTGSTTEKTNESLLRYFNGYEKKQQEAVTRFLRLGYPRIIQTKEGDYSELVGENAVGKPLYLLTSNNNVVTALKADVLQSGTFGGVNLEGLGSTIGLWENGQPRIAHEMFRTTAPPNTLQSRIEYITGQNSTLQRHATHIAGTIIGNQFSPSNTSPQNSDVRGVAFKSTIKAWDWLNIPAEMLDAASPTYNIKIGNTSFGFNPLYMHPAEFGRYNEVARQWDDVMCANKEFQIVKSVGNARDDVRENGYPQYPQVDILQGYDLLEGAGIAKNVLVVGSVNLVGATQTNNSFNGSVISEPYSSYGPTDDGRIKPDFVTQGNNVYSCLETQNNAYGYYTGTSQAAAGVTGGITLLQEYWRHLFTNNMWSSTIRALLIHDIDEIDDKGPDYRNGWGVVNLERAATTIQSRGVNVIIREDVLTNQQITRINVAANGKEDLKVTLAWTDPSGTVVPIDVDNANASINEMAGKLVNDLDVRIIRNDANGNLDTSLVDPAITTVNNCVLFPWRLKENVGTNNAAVLGSQAERGNNDRDNVEKIEVYKNLIPPTGGMYQIEIRHKNTLVNSCSDTGQPYSLIISGVSFCTDDLVFLQHQDDEVTDGAGTKVLSHTIHASNVIKPINPFLATNPDFVEYKAADFIELLPQSNEGFTAEYGSDFYAHIECDGTEFNQRFAFSPRDIDAIANDDKVDENIKVPVGDLVVFPNPLINDMLNIQFSLTQDSTLSINIYDINGKQLLSDTNPKIYPTGVNKKTIDLNRLPTGTYILQTQTADGKRQIKFIKN